MPLQPTSLPSTSVSVADGDVERRRATILFADIEGSTRMIRDLDPEAATELLDPPVQSMVDAVRRHHGTVSHVLGDGVVAIFGAPNSNEDHAVMACLAALTILRGLEGRSGVRVRIGINSGEILLRQMQVGDSRTYDGIGAPVHLAARLEQTAKPGTACLSAATYALARDYVEARRLEPVAMKGMKGKVARYLLRDMNLAASRFGVRSASGLSTFVGRSDELKWLADALGESKARRVVAHLTGPAGIGKSRLLHEFLTGLGTSARVIRLNGSPHTREAAFQPVRSWLLDWAGIKPSDSAAAGHILLHKALARHGRLADAERAQLSNLLGLRDRPSPGGGGAAAPIRLQADGALAALFSELAAGKPLVLALDDVDCFDEASLDLIERVIVHPRLPALLVTTTSRTRFRFSRRVPGTLSRALRPLPASDAERLLALRDPHFTGDRELTQSVIQKTGGNPLFIEEVASLVAQAPDTVRSRLDRAVLRLPDRLEALIADRLSALAKGEARLLGLCALIGNEVPLDLLRLVTGQDEDELLGRLRALQARRLIQRSERGAFSFQHSLIRDVCLGSMPSGVRRAHHARILAMLEETAGARHDERIDDLCYHAINAEKWERAVVHLRAAADAAMEKSAFPLVELYLARALDLCDRLPRNEETLRARIDILLLQRTLVGATGKYAEANRLLGQAETLARRLGDPATQARVLAFRVHVLNILGDLAGSLSAGTRARRVARRSGDPSLLALSNLVLGQAHFNRGEFARAEAALLDNTRLLAEKPVDLRLGAVATLTVSNPVTLAMVQGLQARFAEAAGAAERALAAAAATGRPYDLALARFAEGFVALQRREAEAASSAFGASLEVALKNDLSQMMPPALAGLGHARLIGLDLEGAIERLEAARSLSLQQKRYMIQIWATGALALANARAGNMADAERVGRKAVEVAAQYGFTGFRIPALRALGLARAAAGRRSARRSLASALEIAGRTGAAAESGHCHMALALCNPQDPDVHLQEAGRLYAGAGLDGFRQRLMGLPAADRICLL